MRRRIGCTECKAVARFGTAAVLAMASILGNGAESAEPAAGQDPHAARRSAMRTAQIESRGVGRLHHQVIMRIR